MEFAREIVDNLKEWKECGNRKPILLQGARQIGKTWVMEKFGKECFEYCAKFDFDRQHELHSIFKATKEPARILNELALYCNVPLKAGKTLIVFDEIQECEEALNSLKYFCEDAPDFHVIAAGSLLGVAVKRRSMAVPVGKVKILRMYPISFKEFLKVSDPSTYEYVDTLTGPTKLPEIILGKLKTEYRRYQVCGGMPDAACAMLEGKGMEEIDGTLQDILALYELDFAKYAEPREIPRIHSIWHSLPSQLAKENRKFIYKVVKPGARSKDYEDALLWLEDAGMIYRINNISRPMLPLSAYEDVGAFKVYACDCGLLRRLAGLPASAIMSSTANYTEFKGAIAENAVLQSLLPNTDRQCIYYWSSESRAEIEFVMQRGEDIIPIEVKAEDCISGRSLSIYTARFQPRLRIRYSMLNLQYNNGLLSCPSPLAGWLEQLCKGC